MRDHSALEMVKIIQRGVAGHLTFVAAAAGWSTKSELALYPPIGTILLSRGWITRCQFPLRDGERRKGAPRTIDFVARRGISKSWELAVEVKLLGSSGSGGAVAVKSDIQKLREFSHSNSSSSAFLLVVGSKSEIDKRKIIKDREVIHLASIPQVIADLGRTAWGSVAISI